MPPRCSGGHANFNAVYTLVALGLPPEMHPVPGAELHGVYTADGMFGVSRIEIHPK